MTGRMNCAVMLRWSRLRAAVAAAVARAGAPALVSTVGPALACAGAPALASTVGPALARAGASALAFVVVLALAPAAAPAFAAGAAAPAAVPELLERAQAQLAAGELDPAVRSLTQAREAAPGDPKVYALLASAYARQGADPMAVLQLEKSLQLDSTQVDTRLALAALHAKNRRWQDAGREYQRVLRAEPTNDTAARELGMLYAKAKQPANAVRVLQGYAARHPEDDTVMAAYLEALEQSGQYAELASAAGTALERRPDWMPALRGAARANARLGRQEAALPLLLRWNEREPLWGADAVAVGSAYVAQHDDAEAVVWFNRALQAGPAAAVDWAEMAGTFMRMKRWDDAANCYGRKIGQDSTNVSALVNLALCKQQTKAYDAARIALRSAVAQRPDGVKARYSLAVTYVLMDSVRAARRQYTEVLRTAAGHEDEFRTEVAESARYLSVAYLVEKNWSAAVQALDVFLRDNPADVEMRLYRAQALFALDRKAEARQDFQSVLRQQPQNAAAKKGLDLLAQYN